MTFPVKDDWVEENTPGHTAPDWTYDHDAANAVGAALNVVGQAANVKHHGAVGNGVADDTVAIEEAWSVGDGNIFFPPGNYIYNGVGLDHTYPRIAGSGGIQSGVQLGSTSNLLKLTGILGRLELKDMNIAGGKGPIKHTYTGGNTVGSYHVTRCRMIGYTECAIATDSSDMPWWWISECQFEGSASTIGIAMSPGLTDNVSIRDCQFNLNRVHIKAGSGGNNMHIYQCSFFEYNTLNPDGPRIGIWVVPAVSTVNAGRGFVVRDCKFGNEDLIAGDLRIVYADEGSGATNGVRFPNLGADSTGYIRGHTIRDCAFSQGNVFPPLIYSTTPNINELAVRDIQIADGPPEYVVKFRTVPTGINWLNTRSVIGPFFGDAGNFDVIGMPVSNDVGMGATDDPGQILQTRVGPIRQNGSGSCAAFTELLSTAITAFSVITSTVTPATDAYGGSDAATLNITSAGGIVYATLPDMIVGKPCWVEFDVKQPASGPLPSLHVSVMHWSPVEQVWGTIVEIPSTAMGWITYAFTFTPRYSGNGRSLALNFRSSAPSGTGSTGQVIVGRVRTYQSHERILGGKRPTVAAVASDAGTTQTLANSLRTLLIAQGIVKA